MFLWAANNLARVIGKENVYIDSDGLEILELSKKNGYNIREMIAWLVRDVKNDLYPVHKPKVEHIIPPNEVMCCSSCACND